MDWVKQIPIGQFVPGQPNWLRNLDSRIKFIWVIFFLLSPILSSLSWRIFLVLFLLGVTFLSKLSIRIFARPLIFVALLSILIGLFSLLLPTGETSLPLSFRSPTEIGEVNLKNLNWTYTLIDSISIFGFKTQSIITNIASIKLAIKTSTLLFTVIHSVNIMLITTHPEELIWALTWYLNPLKKIGFSPNKISLQLLLSLRFLPLVQEELQNLLRSLSIRSIELRKTSLKGLISIFLIFGERLFQNILLRASQGANSLLARKVSYFDIENMRGSKNSINGEFVNVISLFIFFMALIIRARYGCL